MSAAFPVGTTQTRVIESLRFGMIPCGASAKIACVRCHVRDRVVKWR